MFEEILMLCSLLLAIYGLANLITNFALWITSPIKKKHYYMVIPLKEGESLKASVRSVRERLCSCGMGRKTKLAVIHWDESGEKQEEMASFCKEQGIVFFPSEEIPQISRFFPFQTEKNKV